MNGDPYSTFHRIGKLISAKSNFSKFSKIRTDDEK